MPERDGKPILNNAADRPGDNLRKAVRQGQAAMAQVRGVSPVAGVVRVQLQGRGAAKLGLTLEIGMVGKARVCFVSCPEGA